MTQQIRGNGIPSWPEALRRAAIPALCGLSKPWNPALSAPARVWRARKLENSARGTRPASLPADGLSNRRREDHPLA